MMNLLQKTAIFLIVIIVFTACGARVEKSTVRSVAVEAVGEMELSRILSFSSNVEGNKETVLATKSPGQIAVINVNIGDSVPRGELLASLTAEVDNANYSIAKIGKENSSSILETSKVLLNKQLEGAGVQVLIAQENLENSKVSENDQAAVLQEQLKNKELNYALAKLAYENTSINFNQEEDNLYDSAQSVILQTAILSKDVIAYLFSINEVDLNEPFDVKFYAKSEYRVHAEISVNSLQRKSNDLEAFYDQKIRDKSPSKSVISDGRLLAKSTIEEVKKALQDMNNVLTDATESNFVINDVLSTYRSTILNYGAKAESLNLSPGVNGNTGLIGIEQSIESFDINIENKLDQAEKQMQIAEQEYLTLQKSSAAKVNELNSNSKLMAFYLDQAESALEAARAKRENQIAILQAQLNQAKGQLQLAGAMLTSTKIYAPYSGVIAEKYLYEGAVVGSGAPILKIVDISNLKLVVFVPEGQIRYFDIGQTGSAFADSMPYEEFSAIVARISPKVEEGSKKIRVELNIDDPGRLLKIGMYMHLRLPFESTEKVLAVPLNSVQDFYGEKTVMIDEDGFAVRKYIKTGLVSDKYIEIVEGLEKGDLVIINGLLNVRDGDRVKMVTDDLPDVIRFSQKWINKFKN